MTLSVNPAASTFLRSSSRWARFLAILGILNVLLIWTGASGLFSLGTSLPALTAFINQLPPELNEQLGFDPKTYTDSIWITATPIALGVFYFLAGALYLFPIIYLYRFGSNASSAVKTLDEVKLEKAFKSLKSHYKFIGLFVVFTFLASILISMAAIAYSVYFAASSI